MSSPSSSSAIAVGPTSAVYTYTEHSGYPLLATIEGFTADKLWYIASKTSLVFTDELLVTEASAIRTCEAVYSIFVAQVAVGLKDGFIHFKLLRGPKRLGDYCFLSLRYLLYSHYLLKEREQPLFRPRGKPMQDGHMFDVFALCSPHEFATATKALANITQQILDKTLSNASILDTLHGMEIIARIEPEQGKKGCMFFPPEIFPIIIRASKELGDDVFHASAVLLASCIHERMDTEARDAIWTRACAMLEVCARGSQKHTDHTIVYLMNILNNILDAFRYRGKEQLTKIISERITKLPSVYSKAEPTLRLLYVAMPKDA